MKRPSLFRTVSLGLLMVATATSALALEPLVSLTLQKTENASTSDPATIAVPAGKALEVVSFTRSVNCPNARLFLTGMPIATARSTDPFREFGFNSIAYAPAEPEKVMVAGPVTLTLPFESLPETLNEGCLLTYRLKDNAANDTAITPATGSAVVIPTDATGPVQILMESSTDLITWTAASPGTYGSSTTKRFFRVRAVQQ